jgi:hypothetical protein
MAPIFFNKKFCRALKFCKFAIPFRKVYIAASEIREWFFKIKNINLNN